MQRWRLAIGAVVVGLILLAAIELIGRAAFQLDWNRDTIAKSWNLGLTWAVLTIAVVWLVIMFGYLHRRIDRVEKLHARRVSEAQVLELISTMIKPLLRRITELEMTLKRLQPNPVPSKDLNGQDQRYHETYALPDPEVEGLGRPSRRLTMPHLLVIVARSGLERHEHVMQAFADEPKVKVIVDRRFAERRQGQSAHGPERRRADRRCLDVEETLRELGWAVAAAVN